MANRRVPPPPNGTFKYTVCMPSFTFILEPCMWSTCGAVGATFVKQDEDSFKMVDGFAYWCLPQGGCCLPPFWCCGCGSWVMEGTAVRDPERPDEFVFNGGSFYKGGYCGFCPCASHEGNFFKVDDDGAPLMMYAERNKNKFHDTMPACGKTPCCLGGLPIGKITSYVERHGHYRQAPYKSVSPDPGDLVALRKEVTTGERQPQPQRVDRE